MGAIVIKAKLLPKHDAHHANHTKDSTQGEARRELARGNAPSVP